MDAERNGGSTMRYNPKARFLLVVILPAIMPALLLPVLGIIHAPDYVMDGAMGFFHRHIDCGVRLDTQEQQSAFD